MTPSSCSRTSESLLEKPARRRSCSPPTQPARRQARLQELDLPAVLLSWAGADAASARCRRLPARHRPVDRPSVRLGPPPPSPSSPAPSNTTPPAREQAFRQALAQDGRFDPPIFLGRRFPACCPKPATHRRRPVPFRRSSAPPPSSPPATSSPFSALRPPGRRLAIRRHQPHRHRRHRPVRLRHPGAHHPAPAARAMGKAAALLKQMIDGPRRPRDPGPMIIPRPSFLTRDVQQDSSRDGIPAA